MRRRRRVRRLESVTINCSKDQEAVSNGANEKYELPLARVSDGQSFNRAAEREREGKGNIGRNRPNWILESTAANLTQRHHPFSLPESIAGALLLGRIIYVLFCGEEQSLTNVRYFTEGGAIDTK